MKLFLRFLALCYFVGFALHVLDLFNFRLSFSEMPLPWKAWISFLMIADFFAAIGLWQSKKWGVRLFIGIAVLQLIAYGGILDSPQNQLFLIGFHFLTLLVYFLLVYWDKLLKPKRS